MAPTSDDKPETYTGQPAGWALQNDPYTIEGELEGLSRFAHGTRTTRRPLVRLVAYVMIAAFVGPILYGLGSLVWMSIFR